MKIFLSGLGCKLNESELEAWTRQFSAEGNEIVSDAGEADLCVVNTCTVTRVAAKKSRALVKRIGHVNNDAKILLTGCYSTMSPEEAGSLPNVALVIPNGDKDQLVALAGKFLNDPSFQISENGCRMPEAASGELSSVIMTHPAPVNKLDRNWNLPLDPKEVSKPPRSRTRAFVKIEDGCNLSCAYCIIPLARGKARSRPQADVVDEVARLAEGGFQEVVLTGVQISDYRLEERGASLGRLRGLCSLVQEILENTALPRLRLTSIAPWDLDEELLDLFGDRRLCRHLHLSLQSGSSAVLRRMRRPYDVDQFAEVVSRARSKVPDVGITTDVIVGFPGESESEFEESLEFVRRMEFARVHVFPYSAREGTLAAHFPLQVIDPIKAARAKLMQLGASESASRFASKCLGKTLPVLYESEAGARGEWSGYTDNYVRVVTHATENLANRILPTRIQRIGEEGAFGSLPHLSTPL
jgi:threonylcarbamoyladenosine tRNA methylthiotransferase MtaB